jgi:hypothetical protein
MRKLATLILLLAACGASSDPAPAARADCEAFVAADYCPAVVPCLTDLTETDCIAAAKTALNCSAAVGESTSLPSCKNELATTTCDVLIAADGSVNLPASCVGVFLLQ